MIKLLETISKISGLIAAILLLIHAVDLNSWMSLALGALFYITNVPIKIKIEKED